MKCSFEVERKVTLKWTRAQPTVLCSTRTTVLLHVKFSPCSTILAPLLLFSALVEVSHDRARVDQSGSLTVFRNALCVREEEVKPLYRPTPSAAPLHVCCCKPRPRRLPARSAWGGAAWDRCAGGRGDGGGAPLLPYLCLYIIIIIIIEIRSSCVRNRQ